MRVRRVNQVLEAWQVGSEGPHPFWLTAAFERDVVKVTDGARGFIQVRSAGGWVDGYRGDWLLQEANGWISVIPAVLWDFYYEEAD